MKTKVLVFTTWDDIVFQNRNTEYGAYVLRRSYHKNVLAGWLVSMGLILVPFVFSGISGPGSGISSIPKIKERIIELLPPPDVEIPVVPPPPARTRPQPLQANPTLPPLVTTDPVEEVPVDDTPPVPNNVVDGTPSGNAASYTDLPVVATNIATVVPE
ncbi:MAG TPA: hypothetical protein VEB86_19660, partial [Chryseosolibacter sp.]|nr:hypothetical protein [Chryseosolibacter sp.]